MRCPLKKRKNSAGSGGAFRIWGSTSSKSGFDWERVALLPSKENSLERLYELGADFAVEQEPLVDKLHKRLDRLTKDERNLIFALFILALGVLKRFLDRGGLTSDPFKKADELTANKYKPFYRVA